MKSSALSVVAGGAALRLRSLVALGAVDLVGDFGSADVGSADAFAPLAGAFAPLVGAFAPSLLPLRSHTKCALNMLQSEHDFASGVQLLHIAVERIVFPQKVVQRLVKPAI